MIRPAADEAVRPEPIRLVIWDLDDTFWRGTLSEGGIDYSDEHHEIVVALARRGIMSSICSKNDHAEVEALLRRHGLWETMVFPSINWDAKGLRVKSIIEDMQLRPASVLFIDDNPMNRREAEHCVPGLRTADETVIAGLLDDENCRGKADPGLDRLRRYQLLARRKADETKAASHGTANDDFLRESNIRIAVEYDLANGVDRVIELINRTNQLNFTKQRLPDDPDLARAELASLVSRTDIIAGIIRIVDNYGDYGDAGFFALKRTATTNRLVHFCFSCRILNMGVEHWVYRFLGEPALRVAGEVASDIKAGAGGLDWIRQVPPEDLHWNGAVAPDRLDEVHLSGSCDLRPLEHYFGEAADRVETALTAFRNGLCLRPDHSVLLHYNVERPHAAFVEDCAPLGFMNDDFAPRILDGEGRRLYVFSFMADLNCTLYRHNETGNLIPLRIGGGRDLSSLPKEKVSSDPERAERLLDQLSAKFTYVGRTPADLFRANLEGIISHISGEMPIFILLPHEQKPDGGAIKSRSKRNKLIRRVARRFPNVRTLSLGDFAEAPSDRLDLNHFDRAVYHRFYRNVFEQQRAWFEGVAA